MPISCPLTATVMSDGQSVDVPGTSEDSSIENSSDCDLALHQLGVVGELVLDEAAGEPDQPRLHPVGIEEGVRHVEQPDDAVAASTGRRAPTPRSVV